MKESLLPEKGYYLDTEDVDERAIEIAYEGASALMQSVIRRAAAPMWELDPQVIEVLKSLRTEPHIAARMTRRSVVDLIFAVEKGRIDYPVKSLSSALGVAQSLIDALAVDGSDSSTRGPLPSQLIGATSLDAVATFPSSFGIRIETNVGDLAGEARAEVALKKLLFLLEASHDTVDLQAALKSISRRAQNHFKAFFKAIESGKSDFKVEAATPDGGNTRRVHLTGQRVRAVVKLLEKEVQAAEREIVFKGRLLGVSLKTKFFLLKNNEAEISGRIANECISKIDEKKINVEHVATLVQRIEVNEGTGEESFKYTLIDIVEA